MTCYFGRTKERCCDHCHGIFYKALIFIVKLSDKGNGMMIAMQVGERINQIFHAGRQEVPGKELMEKIKELKKKVDYESRK